MAHTKASASLIRKLDLRGGNASGGFVALIGYILGTHWGGMTARGYITIDSLSVTSDGFVTAYSNSIGHELFVGPVSEVRRNLANFIAVAGLTKTELDEFNRLYKKKVEDWQIRLGYTGGFIPR